MKMKGRSQMTSFSTWKQKKTEFDAVVVTGVGVVVVVVDVDKAAIYAEFPTKKGISPSEIMF